MKRIEKSTSLALLLLVCGSIASPGVSATPIQLNVQAFACSPELGSPVGTSATAALAKPVADFSMPATAGLNVPVTLTDTSNPQATSWLWIYADGTRDTNQSLLERRLELRAFSNGKYDLAAYGLKGKYRLEAVSTAAIVAWVEEEGDPEADKVVKRR